MTVDHISECLGIYIVNLEQKEKQNDIYECNEKHNGQ